MTAERSTGGSDTPGYTSEGPGTVVVPERQPDWQGPRQELGSTSGGSEVHRRSGAFAAQFEDFARESQGLPHESAEDEVDSGVVVADDGSSFVPRRASAGRQEASARPVVEEPASEESAPPKYDSRRAVHPEQVRKPEGVVVAGRPRRPVEEVSGSSPSQEEPDAASEPGPQRRTVQVSLEEAREILRRRVATTPVAPSEEQPTIPGGRLADHPVMRATDHQPSHRMQASGKPNGSEPGHASLEDDDPFQTLERRSDEQPSEYLSRVADQYGASSHEANIALSKVSEDLSIEDWTQFNERARSEDAYASEVDSEVEQLRSIKLGDLEQMNSIELADLYERLERIEQGSDRHPAVGVRAKLAEIHSLVDDEVKAMKLMHEQMYGRMPDTELARQLTLDEYRAIEKVDPRTADQLAYRVVNGLAELDDDALAEVMRDNPGMVHDVSWMFSSIAQRFPNEERYRGLASRVEDAEEEARAALQRESDEIDRQLGYYSDEDDGLKGSDKLGYDDDEEEVSEERWGEESEESPDKHRQSDLDWLFPHDEEEGDLDFRPDPVDKEQPEAEGDEREAQPSERRKRRRLSRLVGVAALAGVVVGSGIVGVMRAAQHDQDRERTGANPTATINLTKAATPSATAFPENKITIPAPSGSASARTREKPPVHYGIAESLPGTDTRVTLNVPKGAGFEDALQRQYGLTDDEAADAFRAGWPGFVNLIREGEAYMVGGDVRAANEGEVILKGKPAKRLRDWLKRRGK